MGLLARGIKKDDVRRGMCVAKPGSIKQCDHFKAQVRIKILDKNQIQIIHLSNEPNYLTVFRTKTVVS